MNLFVDPRMYINDGSSVAGAANRSVSNDAALKNTCEEFEAVMLQFMFKSMRSTEIDSGLLDKDIATDVYTDLFDGEVARAMAHKQSLGIGEQIYRQLQHSSSVDGL